MHDKKFKGKRKEKQQRYFQSTDQRALCTRERNHTLSFFNYFMYNQS